MQTVLIVDDDRIIASIYRTKLRQEGFPVDRRARGQRRARAPAGRRAHTSDHAEERS